MHAAMHHRGGVCGASAMHTSAIPPSRAAKQATMATILPSFYPQRTKQKEEA